MKGCTYTIKLPLVDEGPLVDALVQPAARLQLGVHGGGKAGYKRVVDGIVHKYSVGGHAGLSRESRRLSFYLK